MAVFAPRTGMTILGTYLYFMMTQEELTTHIRRKLNSGYTEDELRNELIVQGYSETEIGNAMLLAEQKPKPSGSPAMIFVSILFIILGIWRVSEGTTTWGVILIAWGVISLVMRVVQLYR